MKPGDAVEVLIHWMLGAPPHWFRGYRVLEVGLGRSGGLVRVAERPDGAALLTARWCVRVDDLLVCLGCGGEVAACGDDLCGACAASESSEVRAS